MQEKRCKKCNIVKNVECFKKNNKYYSSYCKECEKILKHSYWENKKIKKYDEYKKYIIENLEKEIWKDIKGYEGLYQVSNCGRVKALTKFNNYYNSIYNELKTRIRKERIITFRKTNNNYLQVQLWKNSKRKNCLVHRLVAQSFIPNPENKPQVNHIDGNKQNNNVENLEWATRNENMKHAFKTGLNKPNQYKKVIQYNLDGTLIKVWDCITDFLRANNYNLKSSAISNCCNGKTKIAYGYKWKYL